MRTKQLNKCTLAESEYFKVLGYSISLAWKKSAFSAFIYLETGECIQALLDEGTAFTAHISKLPKPAHGHELAIAAEKSFEETTPFWAMRITPSQITHCSRVSISESPKKLGMSIFLTVG